MNPQINPTERRSNAEWLALGADYFRPMLKVKHLDLYPSSTQEVFSWIRPLWDQYGGAEQQLTLDQFLHCLESNVRTVVQRKRTRDFGHAG